MNVNLKTTFCSLLLLFLLQPQMAEAQSERPQWALKTNPLAYLYPVFNASIEAKLSENSSLDVMVGYIPDNIWLGGVASDGIPQGRGVLGHVMLRRYSQQISNFFFSGGLMLKSFNYVRIMDQPNSNFRETGQFAMAGVKGLVGWQWPLFEGHGVFETFTGASFKVRYQDYYREPFLGSYFDPFEAQHLLPGVGLHLGVAIGPAFPDRRTR